MSITVAKFLDVAEGTQPGQFTVGDHEAVQSLDDLDPIYKRLLDESVTAIVAVISPSGRANLTPVWFDYEGDTVLLNLATHRKKADWLRGNPQATFLLMNPENAYHWLSIKATVSREVSEDDPEEGAAGDRPAQQDLQEVHRRRRVRAARPVLRRAPGALRAQGRLDRHLRAALSVSSASEGGEPVVGMPDVAVVGGSLGGLTTALLLRDAGCRVTVHERSPATLEARGAGIAVLEQTLRYPVERLGVRPEEISTRTQWVRFLEPDGSTAYAEERTYRFSAWNTIYRVLHDAFPAECYLLGRELKAFTLRERSVELAFGDGEDCVADLLVCADGISSASRQQMFPEVAPEYAGYVAWRGTVPESELSAATYDVLHDAITYQVLPHSHILVYPIPGLDGAVEPGRRLVNMVWYRNVPQAELPEFLDRPPRRTPGRLAAPGPRPARAGRRAAELRRGPPGAADRGDGHLGRRTVRAGRVRHRGARDGERAGLPRGGRGVRRPAARRRRHGEGGRGRVGAG